MACVCHGMNKNLKSELQMKRIELYSKMQYWMNVFEFWLCSLKPFATRWPVDSWQFKLHMSAEMGIDLFH